MFISCGTALDQEGRMLSALDSQQPYHLGEGKSEKKYFTELPRDELPCEIYCP